MRLSMICCCVFFLVGGCAISKPVDAVALNGRPYEEVVRANHLNDYHSWPEMNTPPDQDQGVTYFLDRGNLDFKYSVAADGKPGIVHDAQFTPDGRSAEQRFAEANKGWGDYVNAHGGTKPGR